MARTMKDWTNEYPIPEYKIAQAILRTVSWDEVPELCKSINDLYHNLTVYHRIITDYDMVRVIDPDEYDRLMNCYIDGIVQQDHGLAIENIPLREIALWELFMSEYTLADVFSMVDEQVNRITARGKSPELREMWAVYNNTDLHVYIDMTKLSDDIICIIGEDMEWRD